MILQVVFWGGLGFVVLSYAGYPLAVWMLGKGLILGPVGTKFKYTLTNVMDEHNCVIYEVPETNQTP